MDARTSAGTYTVNPPANEKEGGGKGMLLVIFSRPPHFTASYDSRLSQVANHSSVN